MLQGRACQHHPLTLTQQSIQALEPGLAILIRQGLTGPHPCDVLFRVPVIGVLEVPAKASCECLSDGRLSAPGYSHHHDRPWRSHAFSLTRYRISPALG